MVVDKNSGAVDNRGGQDYHLSLVAAPTEAEVLARRAAVLKAAEKERQRVCQQGRLLSVKCPAESAATVEN